jgi:cell division protein FtsB
MIMGGIDYRKWARAPYWSAKQCVALATGEDPDQIGILLVLYHQDLREKVLEAQRNKELPERIRPIVFLAWAREHKIDFPDELEKAVSMNEVDIAQLEDRYGQLERRHDELRRENQELRYERDRLRAAADATPKPPPKEVTPRARSSLLKMVIAMAMAKYGYDPTKNRNEGTVTDIVDEIHARGMQLGDDRVLHYLRQAAELVLPKQQGDEQSA